jgi:GLPGLI family protein
MKKIALIASLAIIGFSVTAFIVPKISTDGGDFEGVITYEISVSDPQYAPMVGTSLKQYIKGTKSKQVQDGMFAKMVFNDYSKPNSQIILIDAMGSKYLVKLDTTKKDADTITPNIKYVDGTKKIAGYTCKKAEVTATVQDQSITTTVYYTEDIVTDPKHVSFKGLKGFPLEYSVSAQGINITFSATKVSKESLPDDTFKAHVSGYKLMTQEEIMADVQKNMQSGN